MSGRQCTQCEGTGNAVVVDNADGLDTEKCKTCDGSGSIGVCDTHQQDEPCRGCEADKDHPSVFIRMATGHQDLVTINGFRIPKVHAWLIDNSGQLTITFNANVVIQVET